MYRDNEIYECPECRDSGFAITDQGAMPCECRRKKREIIARSKLPKIFREIDPANLRPRPEQDKAVPLILKNPAGSYFLWGGTGAGKSHLLACQYLLRSQASVLFRSSAELLAEVQEQEFQDDYVAPAFMTRHLFWDDIQEFSQTEFRLTSIYRVIDHCYRNQIPISITSNLSLRDLVGVLGAHVVRRIDDMCQVLELVKKK